MKPALSSHELSLQHIVCQYLPMTYHPSWWLLQAQHFLSGRGHEYIQVCLTSRFQAVVWQAQGKRSIVGDEIKGRLNLTWSGHMRGVANISDDFLLVVAPERVEWIGHVVLGGKDIDAVLPELLDAGDPPADRFLVITALHHQADMRVAADADVGLLEQVHHLVCMHFVIGGQCPAMAGRDTPLVSLAHGLDGQVL